METTIVEFVAIALVSSIIGFIIGSHLGTKESEVAVQNIRSYFVYEIRLLTNRIKELEKKYNGRSKI